MGKKGVGSGNAYKNPVDNYRKKLGRNEERRLKPKFRSKPVSQRELERSRQLHKNWKSIFFYVVLLLLLMGMVYVFVLLEAGRLLAGVMFSPQEQPDDTSHDHVRVKRNP